MRNPAWVVETRHCYGCEALTDDTDPGDTGGPSTHRVFRPNVGYRVHPADDGD